MCGTIRHHCDVFSGKRRVVSVSVASFDDARHFLTRHGGARAERGDFRSRALGRARERLQHRGASRLRERASAHASLERTSTQVFLGIETRDGDFVNTRYRRVQDELNTPVVQHVTLDVYAARTRRARLKLKNTLRRVGKVAETIPQSQQNLTWGARGPAFQAVLFDRTL